MINFETANDNLERDYYLLKVLEGLFNKELQKSILNKDISNNDLDK